MISRPPRKGVKFSVKFAWALWAQLNLKALGSFSACSAEAKLVGYWMPEALRARAVRMKWRKLTKKVEDAAVRT